MLWDILSVAMEFEFVILLFGLFCVAVLYSSVGHGGASGYLAVLSMTSYGLMESLWLKQHSWILNLVVAGIAFFYYQRNGFHNLKLTMPFIVASIPMAFIGGYISIDDLYYDILLSLVLFWASWAPSLDVPSVGFLSEAHPMSKAAQHTKTSLAFKKPAPFMLPQMRRLEPKE